MMKKEGGSRGKSQKKIGIKKKGGRLKELPESVHRKDEKVMGGAADQGGERRVNEGGQAWVLTELEIQKERGGAHGQVEACNLKRD